MARPTKYHKGIPDLLLEHFDIKPYEIPRKDGAKIANDFPTLAGFAIKLGVHRDTLHQWASEHPEFSDAYGRAKDFQENFLIVNGLKGLVASNFAMFTAKNVLGWRDKQPGEEDQINIHITLADRMAKARARGKKK